MKDHEQCFAVVRIDDGPTSEEERITVKLVTWDLEDARREVTRLNALNGEKGCRYFWTPTRSRSRT